MIDAATIGAVAEPPVRVFCFAHAGGDGWPASVRLQSHRMVAPHQRGPSATSRKTADMRLRQRYGLVNAVQYRDQ
jgi:hypothetical protein